jgi:pimeloyl-ACP methyl ester carboxylesterase
VGSDWVNLYVESHGAGRLLILLHGGLGSGEMFGPVIPALAERHQVFVVDLQGARPYCRHRPVTLAFIDQ